MKNKVILGIVFLLTLFLIGCTKEASNVLTFNGKESKINVLATTDLHGIIPYELSSYVKDEYKKDENITLVDAGDFFDVDYESSGDMQKYSEKRQVAYKNNDRKYIEVPIAKEMKEVGYNAVVLGNHEFISNDKTYLDSIISDFQKQGIEVLSANTYEKNGDNYVKPYIIKDIKTSEGTVKLGILGLTVKEVGEKYHITENGEKIQAKSRDLKDQYGYDGKLYMNDLVEDAKKWVNIMKKDKPDVIIAVVHSGEKPKKPKNPGNRIQELAQEVEGIDAIVAGHTHKQISQHDYKNKSGETVIVTQPGAHGEAISKINFRLKKNNDKWTVVDKSSKITKIEKYSDIDNYGKLLVNASLLDNKTKEVRLSELTPFKWDKAYVFAKNTPRETIYKTVGYKWKGITETESDDMVQMVFMKGKKPVCYVYGYVNQIRMSVSFDKSEYKDNVVTISPKNNDKFKVEKKDENSITNLIHIQ